MGDENYKPSLSPSQMANLMRIIGGYDGAIGLLNGDRYVARKFVQFGVSEYGHVNVLITGRGWHGQLECAELTESGFTIESDASAVMCMDWDSEWNRKHVIVQGEQYRVAFVRASQFDSTWTLDEIGTHVYREFGYVKLKAGAVPLLVRMLDEDRMKKLQVKRIFGFHKPLAEALDVPVMICVNDKRTLSTRVVDFGRLRLRPWKPREVMYAFLVPHQTCLRDD